MALNPPIDPIQTEAKKPIDQELMDAIRINLEDLDGRTTFAASADFSFRVNGNLDFLDLDNDPNGGRELDTAFISQERTLSLVSMYLDQVGEGGTLEFDVKRLKFLGTPIKAIEDIFSASTQSIVRASAALSTQSVTRAEPTLATQLVENHLPADNIYSFQVIGPTSIKINFDTVTPLNEFYQVGDWITIDGATDTNLNGTFQLIDKNLDGGVNIVLANPFITADEFPTTAGAAPALAEYVYLATLPANFTVGEDVTFSGHTDPSNNGTFTIAAVNAGANNLVVKKTAAVVTQGSASGQADINRFSYNFTAATPDQFAVGEDATFSGHTAGANDGSFDIKAVNEVGNNIIIYNPSGVIQAAPAGQADVNRWIYALDASATGFIVVGDDIILSGHTSGVNDGSFEAREVSYLGADNVVIYNPAGTPQAGVDGIVGLAQKAIILREDISSFLENNISQIEVQNTDDENNSGVFTILDSNRVAISPFNVIVEIPSGVSQPLDGGLIYSEFRSLFVNGSASVEATKDKTFQNFSVLDGDIIGEDLEADTIILFDVLQAPANSANLSINLK